MCGIIGYLTKNNQQPASTAFEQAVDSLTHRGPDQRGIWTHQNAGLGFRRLSIIDLEGGNQPMSNEDGSLHLVFNGEIYNFEKLRAHLEAKGHRFRSRSDSEVILHLYEEEGERCVEQLQGMFAFAIYDRMQETLFLARDRFGKKPLVYSETQTGFYFASEINALLKLADCSRDIDFPAIDAYFTLSYTPGIRTVWREIHRIPAASTLWVRHGKAESPLRYWHLNWAHSVYESLSEQDALDIFREHFEESVRLRMVADVPVGVFLSGGVDSSITAAAMSQIRHGIKTFSIGFEDPRFDESPYAREIARRLNTNHHEIIVAPDSLEILNPLIEKLGEPFADHSLLPTFLLSQFTRQHVTVALSGDGGDELWGGYKRYRYLAQAAFLQHWGLRKTRSVASKVIFQLEKLFNPSRRHLQWPRSAMDQILGHPPVEQYLRLVGCWREEDLKNLWKHLKDKGESFANSWIKEVLATHPGLTDLSRWQALDAETYLIDDILRKVDVATMACSLECRCPMLDHGIAEFVAGLPEKFKVNRKNGAKALLKKLYPKLLPPYLFEREKKGFSMPIGKWMRGQWKESIRISIEGVWSHGMEKHFQRKILQCLWKEHQEGKEDHGHRLWAWFVFYRWNESFKPNWDF